MDAGDAVKRLRQFLARTREKVPEVRKRYLLLLATVTAGVLFLREYFIGLLLVATTVTFAVLVKRADLNKLGLELATFSTVISGYHFGPETGALMGLVLVTTQMLTGRPGVYILWVVPTFGVAGFLSGKFSGTEITVLGPAISVGMQTVFVSFTALLSRESLGRYFQYYFFNIAFNLVLFTALGPPVIQLLASGPIY